MKLRLWTGPNATDWCSAYPDRAHCFVPTALRAVSMRDEPALSDPSVCLDSDYFAKAVKACACGLVVIAIQ